MINIRFILISCIGLLFIGCTSTNTLNSSKTYLKNKEIIKLISGKTLYLNDNTKTREFFDKNGRLYDYYTRDNDGFDGKWQVKDNKLCLQYRESKTKCDKVEKVSKGYIVDGELAYKIVNGDKFNIKNSFDWGDSSIEHIKLWD